MPQDKQPIREVQGRSYLRIPIRTHVVTEADDVVDVARRYAGPLLQPGDILFAAEKTVAITQGRAIPISTMHPGWLARTLWRFVRQTSYGVGLRDPYSMQAAIDEVGAWRIALAAVVGGITRALGRRGDFYRIAGVQAAAIDAPGTAGIEQFKDRVIKGPKDPDGVAVKLRDALGCEAAVVDCNDIDSAILGHSPGVDARLLRLILLDNPLGQGDEQTPLGIVREVSPAA
jgi:F420-0:gamma-glutamyl ligase